MTTATLSRWGNGQGIRLSKDVCDVLGITIGARATIDVNETEGSICLHFEKEPAQYQRRSKKTMKELAAGWTGEKVGEEWGGPDVGAEVVK